MIAPIKTQMAMAMCSVDLPSFAPITNGTGQRLPDGRAEKNRKQDEQFRLHVMNPKPFHFPIKPNAVNDQARPRRQTNRSRRPINRLARRRDRPKGTTRRRPARAASRTIMKTI